MVAPRSRGLPHGLPIAVPPHKQSVGLETSQDPYNELEERYRRLELTTFCELFAQLRKTTGERCGSARELVDPVRPSLEYPDWLPLRRCSALSLYLHPAGFIRRMHPRWRVGRCDNGACLVSTCW